MIRAGISAESASLSREDSAEQRSKKRQGKLEENVTVLIPFNELLKEEQEELRSQITVGVDKQYVAYLALAKNELPEIRPHQDRGIAVNNFEELSKEEQANIVSSILVVKENDEIINIKIKRTFEDLPEELVLKIFLYVATTFSFENSTGLRLLSKRFKAIAEDNAMASIWYVQLLKSIYRKCIEHEFKQDFFSLFCSLSRDQQLKLKFNINGNRPASETIRSLVVQFKEEKLNFPTGPVVTYNEFQELAQKNNRVEEKKRNFSKEESEVSNVRRGTTTAGTHGCISLCCAITAFTTSLALLIPGFLFYTVGGSSKNRVAGILLITAGVTSLVLCCGYSILQLYRSGIRSQLDSRLDRAKKGFEECDSERQKLLDDHISKKPTHSSHDDNIDDAERKNERGYGTFNPV